MHLARKWNETTVIYFEYLGLEGVFPFSSKSDQNSKMLYFILLKMMNLHFSGKKVSWVWANFWTFFYQHNLNPNWWLWTCLGSEIKRIPIYENLENFIWNDAFSSRNYKCKVWNEYKMKLENFKKPNKKIANGKRTARNVKNSQHMQFFILIHANEPAQRSNWTLLT